MRAFLRVLISYSFGVIVMKNIGAILTTTLTFIEKVSLVAKRALAAVYWRIPGKLAVIKNPRETYTVYRNLWVRVSDGHSSDLLPLSMCSQSFADLVLTRISKRLIIRAIRLTPRQQSYLTRQNNE